MLARKNREDFNRFVNCGKLTGYKVSNSDKEESDRWLDGDSGLVEAQHKVHGDKL